MELLLNLVWIAIALGAFSVFARGGGTFSRLAKIPYWKAVLALACVLVLLFPVVSASDDLHPTQAVLEDATKRIQQLVAPLQHSQGDLVAAMVSALLAAHLVFALVALRCWQPIACEARLVHHERTPRDGRSPPAL